MKRLLVAVLVIAGFAAGWYFRGRSAPALPRKSERTVLYWVDPMHPQYKSDKPGIAPDCGMRLEPVYADGGEGGSKRDRKILYYFDPKDPKYHSDHPGLNPETGNDLEPFYAEDVPGSIHVSPEKQQLIGVRTGMVDRTSASVPLRTVGKVDIDERRISHVHSRVAGWIEKVNADYTGRYVRKGEPLFTVYSPELIASQQEYLLALTARKMMARSSVQGAADDSERMVEAARRRLEHWNLSKEQIQELEHTQTPIRSVTVEAPASGYITARNAFPNLRIGPETQIYTLVDLSQVWIIADVYESDAALVRVGQEATISASYLPGRKIRARVTYILPQVDPDTRTLKVRLEAPNPGLVLKPEMYVDVDFIVPQGSRLVVPAEAVLDAGVRKIVFVDLGDGYFEPRNVATGLRLGDRIEILEGLKEGERIVVSGNFLLNSESQLKWPNAGAAAGHGVRRDD